MKNLIQNTIFWLKPTPKISERKLVLHIGVEKTGSTTIQEFLHQNRVLLRAQGIIFPLFPDERNHIKLAAFCANEDERNQFVWQNKIDTPQLKKEWNRKFEKLFAKEIQQILKQGSTVIFSSEHFSSYLKSENEVFRLKDFLSPFFKDFLIIVYIRRQDQIENSMIANTAKAGLSSSLPEGNQIKSRHFYNYEQTLQKWGQAFGKENICVRVFEKSKLVDGDLLHDFMHYTGIENNNQFKIPERLNVAPSAMAIEAAWLFIKKFPGENHPGHWNLLRLLRIKLMQEINKQFPGPPIKFHKTDAERFFNQYQKSNRSVAREWLGQENLFSDDFSMYSDADTEALVDREQINNIVNDFISRNPALKSIGEN